MKLRWREAKVGDVCLYFHCLESLEWRKSYGSFGVTSHAELVQSLALARYPSVRRFVVVAQNRPIGFFHFNASEESEQRKCTLSGGVHPAFVGSGLGVSTCCAALNVAFQIFDYSRVNCEVLTQNPGCSRMLTRAGFRLQRSAKRHVYDPWSKEFLDMQFFGISAAEFPNDFVRKVLGKFPICPETRY